MSDGQDGVCTPDGALGAHSQVFLADSSGKTHSEVLNETSKHHSVELYQRAVRCAGCHPDLLIYFIDLFLNYGLLLQPCFCNRTSTMVSGTREGFEHGKGDDQETTLRSHPLCCSSSLAFFLLLLIPSLVHVLALPNWEKDRPI